MKKIIFCILTFSIFLSVNAQAKDELRDWATGKRNIFDLKKKHEQCIKTHAKNFYSQRANCATARTTNFEEINRQIKLACDAIIDEKLPTPNSHEQLNAYRNLRSATAVIAYEILEDASEDFLAQCKLRSALDAEINHQDRRGGADIRIMRTEGVSGIQ